jgi:hypothetical protein
MNILFSFRSFLLASFLSFLLPAPVIHGQEVNPNLAAVTNAVESLLKLTDGAFSTKEYEKKLQDTEAAVQKSLPSLAEQQKGQVEKILRYLRATRDLLQWRRKHRDKEGNFRYSDSDKELNSLFTTYPFLRSAIMEKAPEGGTGLFDPDTALTFLWDRTEREVDEGEERRRGPVGNY